MVELFFKLLSGSGLHCFVSHRSRQDFVMFVKILNVLLQTCVIRSCLFEGSCHGLLVKCYILSIYLIQLFIDKLRIKNQKYVLFENQMCTIHNNYWYMSSGSGLNLLHFRLIKEVKYHRLLRTLTMSHNHGYNHI